METAGLLYTSDKWHALFQTEESNPFMISLVTKGHLQREKKGGNILCHYYLLIWTYISHGWEEKNNGSIGKGEEI